MRNGSLVSIVIPIYNVEKYLGECLDSVLNQTYHNIEILCVYDKSPDQSLTILEEYAKHDNRIQIIINERKRGLSVARNIGLSKAKGKYLYFLDSDDCIELNAIEKLYKYAEEFETEGVYFDSKFLKDDKYEDDLWGLSSILENGEKKICDGPTLFEFLTKNNIFINCVWRCLWRRDFLIKSEITFPDELEVGEDQQFSIEAMICSKRVMIINESYHIYRKHEGSGTAVVTPKRMVCAFKGYNMILDYWKNYQKNEKISDGLKKIVEKRLIETKRIYRLIGNQINIENLFEGVERHLFEVMIEQKYEKGLKCIDSKVLEEIRKYKYVIVYGARLYAAEAVEKLEKNDIKVYSLAVTQMYEDVKRFSNIPLHEIRDLCSYKDESIIVLGVGKYCKNEIIDTLKKYGFNHYVSLD